MAGFDFHCSLERRSIVIGVARENEGQFHYEYFMKPSN